VIHNARFFLCENIKRGVEVANVHRDEAAGSSNLSSLWRTATAANYFDAVVCQCSGEMTCDKAGDTGNERFLVRHDAGKW